MCQKAILKWKDVDIKHHYRRAANRKCEKEEDGAVKCREKTSNIGFEMKQAGFLSAAETGAKRGKERTHR